MRPVLLFFFASPFVLSLYSSGFTAESKSLPTSVTILTKENFVGHPYFSVADALRDVPFVDIQRIGSQGTRALVKLRGAPSEENVIVLLDGEILSHTYDGAVDFSQIPINIVERLEISRGGGPVSFGTAGIGGTINIVTIRPNKKGLSSQVGTGVGRDGVKHSHGQFTGRSRLGDLTYLGSIEEANGFMTNEDSKQNNHFVNLSRSFNGQGFWGAEYYFQESKVGQGQGTGVPFKDWDSHLEQASSNEFRFKQEEHQHAKLFLVSPKLKNNTFHLSLTQRIRESNIFSNEGGASIRDQENRTMDVQLKWQRSSFEMGIKRSQWKRNIFATNENKAFEDSIYAFQKFSIGKWIVLPGANAILHSEANSALDPRISVLHNWSNEILFSATAQTAHRAPHFDELYFSTPTQSNPDLKFESSHSADLGMRWTPSESFEWVITGFQNHINDAIETDSNNRLQNDGTASSKGLETKIQLQIQNHRLEFQGTTLSSKQNQKRSAMTPEKLASIRLSHELPYSLTLTNTFRYQGPQWEQTNKQGLKIDSSLTWDLRLACKIHSANLYFEAHNLNRQRYADAFEIFTPTAGLTQTRLAPQPERTFWGGISIRFEN